MKSILGRLPCTCEDLEENSANPGVAGEQGLHGGVGDS